MKKRIGMYAGFRAVVCRAKPRDSPAKPATTSEVEQLKQMLVEQQRQINELKQSWGCRSTPGVPVNTHAGIGEVASTTPGSAAPAPAAAPSFTPEPSAAHRLPTPRRRNPTR